MTEFQTISQFVKAPFGNNDVKRTGEYETEYKSVKNKLKITGYTEIDDNFLLHVTVPSKSNNNQIYDVVILFFTDTSSVKKERTLNNYYIKFFSNSPSFIYKYAALYKLHGYLIESFFDKMDKEYSDTMPDKSNKDYEMFYDKSIYFTCRFLLDSKTALSKFGIILHHKKSQSAFFRDIKDFQDTKFSNDTKSLDKKIEKELDTLKRERSVKNRNVDRVGVKPKKFAGKSTGESHIKHTKRISASHKKSKIQSRKTTVKK